MSVVRVVELPCFAHLKKGTLITNFIGPFGVANEISSICTQAVTENHPLGKGSLGCIWILAFAILRTLAEQLDFVFEAFDPVSTSVGVSVGKHHMSDDGVDPYAQQSARVPQLQSLPSILEKSNKILLIDRYLSSLEEFSSFLLLYQKTIRNEAESYRLSERSKGKAAESRSYKSTWLRERTALEAARTQSKIQRQQKLCANFSTQFEALINMVNPTSLSLLSFCEQWKLT